MNVSHWVISQGGVKHCGPVWRGKERVCNPLWPMGHSQMSVWRHTRTFLFHKQVRHTHKAPHTSITAHKCTQLRIPTASGLVILIAYSDGVSLWTPSWQTELESKRGTEGGRKGREKQTHRQKPSPFSVQPAVIGWWQRVLSFLFANWPPRHWLWREFYPKTRACPSAPWNTPWPSSTHLAI